MSRVKIVVGGHEVEVEFDGDFNTAVGKALYLFEKTIDEARNLHIGFGTSNLITELGKEEDSGGRQPQEGLSG